MVCLSIVCILPNFWVCGLQISSPGTFMLTPFVRKAVKSSGLAIGCSNQRLPTSVTPSTLHLFALSSNMAPSTKRLEATGVILQAWDLSHEDLLQDSNLPPLNKSHDVASLCHLYKIFSNLSSSPIPLRPHPKPNLGNLNSSAVLIPFFPADLNPTVLLSIRLLTLELPS